MSPGLLLVVFWVCWALWSAIALLPGLAARLFGGTQGVIGNLALALALALLGWALL